MQFSSPPGVDTLRILIIKPSSLGDVIHGLPALSALRQAYPESQIAWVVQSAFEDILPAPPILDQRILFPRRTISLESLRRMVRELREFSPDLTLDFQGLLRSGIIAWLAGGKRLGFKEAREGAAHLYHRRISSPKDRHAVLRNLDLAALAGASWQAAPQFPLADPSPLSPEITSLLPEGDFVALCPGARWPSKRWPVESFHLLAAMLNERHIPSVILASQDDLLTGDRIALNCASFVRSLAGRTSLLEAHAVLAKARAVVSVDTGLMHLAAALGRPIVALFGPTSERRTGPISTEAVVVRAETPCAPCFKKQCDDNRCMMDIDPASVMAELERFL